MNLQIQIETGSSPGYSCTEGLVDYLRTFSELSPDSMKKGQGQCYWGNLAKRDDKGLGQPWLSLPWHCSVTYIQQCHFIPHLRRWSEKWMFLQDAVFSNLPSQWSGNLFILCSRQLLTLLTLSKKVPFFIWTQMWSVIHKYCRCMSLPKWIIFYEGDYSHTGNEYASDTGPDWKLTT